LSSVWFINLLTYYLAASSADAKEFAKLKNLPAETRLKLIIEEFKQKETLPGWAQAISTKLSEAPELVNKLRDISGYRKYGTSLAPYPAP